MNSSLTVAVVQLTSGEDVAANVEQILDEVSGMDGAADLICLPENSLFMRIGKGASIHELQLDDPALLRLKRFSDEKKSAMMIGSVPYRQGGHLYNSTVFLEPQKEPRVVYSKLHLFDVDVPGAPPSRESENFRHGPQAVLLEYKGWKIGLSICYDIRFSELFLEYARAQADLILIPAAFLVPTGQAHWEILVRARAIESQCFIAAAAQSGEHVSGRGEKRFTYGHSMIVGPWGDKRIDLSGQRGVGIAKLERSELEKVRRQIPMRQHRSQRQWERNEER